MSKLSGYIRKNKLFDRTVMFLKCPKCAKHKHVNFSLDIIEGKRFTCDICGDSYIEKKSSYRLYWVLIIIIAVVLAEIAYELIYLGVTNTIIRVIIKMGCVFLAIYIAHIPHCFFAKYERDEK